MEDKQLVSLYLEDINKHLGDTVLQMIYYGHLKDEDYEIIKSMYHYSRTTNLTSFSLSTIYETVTALQTLLIEDCGYITSITDAIDNTVELIERIQQVEANKWTKGD